MRAARVLLECRAKNKEYMDSVVCINSMDGQVGDIGKLTHEAYKEGLKVSNLTLAGSLSDYHDSDINELYLQIDQYLGVIEENFANRIGMKPLNANK